MHAWSDDRVGREFRRRLARCQASRHQCPGSARSQPRHDLNLEEYNRTMVARALKVRGRG